MTKGLKPMAACIIRMCTFLSSGEPLDFRRPPWGKSDGRRTNSCDTLAESQARGSLHRLCHTQFEGWPYIVLSERCTVYRSSTQSTWSKESFYYKFEPAQRSPTSTAARSSTARCTMCGYSSTYRHLASWFLDAI